MGWSASQPAGQLALIKIFICRHLAGMAWYSSFLQSSNNLKLTHFKVARWMNKGIRRMESGMSWLDNQAKGSGIAGVAAGQVEVLKFSWSLQAVLFPP